MTTKHIERWAVLWRSDNRLDGRTRRFMLNGDWNPVLLRTRAEARQWVRKHYGYIAQRPDLQTEPHGWKMPLPVKVRVTLELLSAVERLGI